MIAANNTQGTVSVVVPTWQRAAWLRVCVEAILLQCPAELLVVGRAIDADAREVVMDAARRAKRTTVRWLEVDRAGHIAPVRRGLAEARGEFIAFVDDDSVPQPGWLQSITAALTQSDVACAGGMVITPGFNGKVTDDAGRLQWHGQLGGNIGALEAATLREVDAVMECNWIWRRSIMSRLEFDPVLDFDDASMYGLDLCLQARQMGYKVIYEPKAKILNATAPRDASLDRNDRAARGFCFSRNYTYILLKRSHGVSRLAFAVWWSLIGCRGSYGLITAIVDAILRPQLVKRQLGPALRGKLEGWRLWRRASLSALAQSTHP